MNKVKDMVALWNTDSTEIRDMSHCKGFGRWEDSNWSNSLGSEMLIRYRWFLPKFGYNPNTWDPRVIDFGCGGGSNLMVLRGELCGVDISRTNIIEARKQNPWADYVLYDPEYPEDLINDIPFIADVFISTYVFQHFPSKDYTKHVINLMTHMVKKGGLFLVQFRHNNDNPTKFTNLKYADGYVKASRMHPNDFKNWLEVQGFSVVYEEKQVGSNDYMWFGGSRIK